jgi:hypothetical protein
MKIYNIGKYSGLELHDSGALRHTIYSVIEDHKMVHHLPSLDRLVWLLDGLQMSGIDLLFFNGIPDYRKSKSGASYLPLDEAEKNEILKANPSIDLIELNKSNIPVPEYDGYA